MWKTGTLSYEEFENDLLDFLERARKVGDPWNMQISKSLITGNASTYGCDVYRLHKRIHFLIGKKPNPQGRREVKYLTKPQVEQLRHHKIREEETDVTSAEDRNWGVEENDDCAVSSDLHSSENTEFVKFEYHVIYSFSYNVPVLYFTASRQDGKLVSLEEVWANIPDVYHERLAYEKWTFLTQQEHPYLGVPFYQLHPCHTADMMKRASSVSEERESHGSANYLVTWLSTVGPVVGLNIPVAYSL